MAKLKSINIKGKQYVTVNERLQFFRDTFKDHSLETELISVDDRTALVRAVIRDKDGRLVATGTAYERADAAGSLVNKTSHVENAETSAWGRALGCLGIGIDTSVASADEVKHATTAKVPYAAGANPLTAPATADDLARIKTLAESLGGTVEQVYDTFTGGRLPTVGQATTIISQLHIKKQNLDKELNAKAVADSPPSEL